MNELEFYSNVKNWDFSMIKREDEVLTNWDMYEELKKEANKESKILDLGTAGGEKVLKKFPEVKEILGTDFSPEMIETAKQNLAESGKEGITFRVMDNLNMDTPDDYFDFVVARHTVTDPKQIYKTLKPGGRLFIRGVDKLDCWELKRFFNGGQAFLDEKPISVIDYENVLDAGFKDVELVPIHVREFYKTKEDLMALLYKVPILCNFSEEEENDNLEETLLDENRIDEFIKNHTYDKGILLVRRYYGISATK